MRLPTSLLCLFAAGLPAQAGGGLFDRVAVELGERYFDREFCRSSLPALLQRFRPSAAAAAGGAEERAVVHALLGEIPSSHLALYSEATWRHLEAEITGRPLPTFGLQLLERGGRFFADGVLDGGPAAAVLADGEEVLAVDGLPPGRSPRLDWRADDAFLEDPPVHDLLAAAGDEVELLVAAPGGPPRRVALRAARWSALAASEASARLIDASGQRLLYLHLWYVFHGRSAPLLAAAVAAAPTAAGLLLDLRGRGGSALECADLLAVLQRTVQDAGMPLVVLMDGRTRSAKEVLAFELRRRRLGRLVGERTAGAVLPASFVRVGQGAVLMLPEATLGAFSRAIEGRGVEPDVAVAAAAGDPILAAGCRELAAALAGR